LALGALLLLFLLVFFAADVRQFFKRTDDLFVLMPSAAGLREGSLVWVAGQTVGAVKRIAVRPPGSDSLQRVLVHVEIERRHREHVRADSEARVTSFRVIGDPVLDITPGDPALPAIEPGDTLQFRAQGSPAAALQRAVSLHASLRALLRESKQVEANVRDRSAQAARVSRQLMVSARELRAFTITVQEGPVNTFSDPEFKRIIESLAGTIGQLRRSFAQAVERARGAHADAAPALARLSARTDTIAGAIAQLQQAVAAGGGGLLIRAQTDSAIVKALHGAQAQLDSLVVETRRNPLRFWF
jgi:ABC-type transporter Mla subunit MlaD